MPTLFRCLRKTPGFWPGVLAALLAFPAASQDAAAARKALGELREVPLSHYYTVRAAAALPDEAFAVAASSYADNVLTPYALVVLPDGRVVGETPVTLPAGNWPLGGRIDRLVAKPGGGVYGVGHVSASPNEQVGWIVELNEAMETVASVTLPVRPKERTRVFLYAAALDGDGDLVVAGRAGEPGRSKPVDGVVARLGKNDLRPIGQAKLIKVRSTRWGIQDLVLDDEGKAIVVGWIENQKNPDNNDDFIALRLNRYLQNEGGYSRGSAGNDIAYRILKRGGAFTMLTRIANGDRSIATAFSLQNGEKLRDKVVARRDLQGQGPQAFRSGVYMPDGALLLFGMSAVDAKSDRRRLFGTVLGDRSGQTILAKSCTKSRAWDAAATAQGALIVVNDCVPNGQQRQSAMILVRTATAPAVAQRQEAVRPVYSTKLSAAGGRVTRQALDAGLRGPVKVFAAANGMATVSLVGVDGRIADVQTATPDQPALLVARLGDGERILEVETDERQVEVAVSVLQASSADRNAVAAAEALTFSAGEVDEIMRGLRWIEMIGVGGVKRHLRGATPTSELRRRLATYQFGRDLPPSGYFDDRTRLHIALDAAAAAGRAAQALVAEAREAMRRDTAERLIAADGQEIARGAWRGAVFLGGAPNGYVGEWARDETGALRPNGLGAAPMPGGDRDYFGEFRDGVPFGFGGVVERSGALSQRGEFRGELRGYGALFRNGEPAKSGLFAARGSLLKAVRL